MGFSAKLWRLLTTTLTIIGGLCVLGFLSAVGLVAFLVHDVSKSVESVAESSTSSLASFSGNTSRKVFTLPNRIGKYIADISLQTDIDLDVADVILQKLKTARQEEDVVGVLLEVSSPGGAVVPSQEIFDAVQETAKQKPVVAYVREMAASGAYYSVAPASYIVASRGALVGSIGVILQGAEAHELLRFLKVTPVTLKTGSLKDAGSPTRAFTDADKKYLQELINATREQFVADVKATRRTSDSTMSYLADGRVVLAPQAQKLRLVDAVGSRESALREISTLAKTSSNPKLFYYDDVATFSDLFAKGLRSQASGILAETLEKVWARSQPSTVQLR